MKTMYFLSLMQLLILLGLANAVLGATDEPMLAGKIYTTAGHPVRNAKICLYRADYASHKQSSTFPRGASRCRNTDKKGQYSLYFPDRTSYVLIAGYKDNWVMRSITPDASSDTIVVTDTIKPVGSLTFSVKAETGNDHRANLSLNGTPYSFVSDSTGTFTLNKLPAGTFSAIIQSLATGHRAVRCSLRVRSSQSDKVPVPLLLPKQTVAYTPAAEKTVGVSDSGSKQLPQYSKPVSESARAKTDEALKSPPPPQQAPQQKTPQLQPPVVKAPADTFIGIFESLLLSGTVKTESQTVVQEWDIGGTGTFIESPDGRIEIPPFKTSVNRLPCIFRAREGNGPAATDTTYVYAGLLWMSISPPKELLGRNGHSFLTFNDALFIVGGNRSDVWSSSDGINWTMLTQSAPFGKVFGHTTTVFNDRLWVIGGKTGPTSYNRSIWSSSNGVNWQKHGDLPFPPRHYHTAVSFNNKLWVTGGISTSENEPFLNDLWSSADGRSWTHVTGNAPFGKRYGHGCTVFNGAIYLLGGFNDAVGNRTVYNDVWRSEDGAVWNKVGDSAPFSGSNYHSICVFDNRLWAVGGYTRKDNSDQFADILFTTNGTNWTNLTPDKSSEDRFFCASAVFNNRIIISPSDSHKLWIMR